MPAVIQFNDEWGGWSASLFWIVVLSILLTLAFTFVVFIGGLFDLRFLLRAMEEHAVDTLDDGRVIAHKDDIGTG